MLAMVVNDNAGSLMPRGVRSSIASLLAPTGNRDQACSSATPAPTRPEYGAVTSHTGIPLK